MMSVFWRAQAATQLEALVTEDDCIYDTRMDMRNLPISSS
jgi:hypothetical protein